MTNEILLLPLLIVPAVLTETIDFPPLAPTTVVGPCFFRYGFDTWEGFGFVSFPIDLDLMYGLGTGMTSQYGLVKGKDGIEV